MKIPVARTKAARASFVIRILSGNTFLMREGGDHFEKAVVSLLYLFISAWWLTASSVDCCCRERGEKRLIFTRVKALEIESFVHSRFIEYLSTFYRPPCVPLTRPLYTSGYVNFCLDCTPQTCSPKFLSSPLVELWTRPSSVEWPTSDAK